MLAHPSSCPGSSSQGAPSRSLAQGPMAVAPSPASRPSPTARGSDDAVVCGVCSYSVDDDSSGWTQHQRCHDEDGGQDDQDDDPDIQDVLGEVGRTCEVREVHPTALPGSGTHSESGSRSCQKRQQRQIPPGEKDSAWPRPACGGRQGRRRARG